MKLKIPGYARIAEGFVTRRVPVYAHWGITHRCNLTCKMCGIWRYGNRKEELEIPEVQQMAAKMARLGVVQLSIGGGEPYACEYLEEAAKCFVDEGLNVRVLTNGIGVSEDRLKKTVDYGVRNFSISLDSLYPERFDYICEHEGSWELAVRSMVTIGKLLEGTKGMPTINCVVSNLNLEELPDIVRFAKRIGFHVSFLPVELLADAKAGQRNWEARFIRYRPEMGVNAGESPDGVRARIDHAYDTIIQMKQDGWPILNSTPYLEASRMYLKTGRFPAEGCDAGRLYFSVAPNGQFTACHRTQHQHLHFLDPDFEAYWNSVEYERKRMLEAGSCEGCMRACWIDTSYMFRTMEGFIETASTVLTHRMGKAPTWDEAWAWAKHDQIDIVPGAAAKADSRAPISSGGVTNIFAIARRELGAYFDSPLAYFVVPAYVMLVGGFALWFDDLFSAGTVSLRGVFLWSAVFLVLLVPAITMRLFAEERRTGSIELLVTLPITEGQLVLGKYLAALTLVSVAIATTLTYVVTLAVLGTPEVGEGGPPMLVRAFSETGLDFGPALCGYFGLLLFGGALAAIGTAASSLTSNQVVAFLLALLVSIFPYLTGFFLDRVPAELLPLVQHLSFDYHFNNLARGVIDTRSLVFWGSVAALSLHVATFSLERRRLS